MNKIALLICVLVLPSWLYAGEDSLTASEECLECHEEVQEITRFTVHNQAYQVGCVDCHGTGEEHIDDPEIDNIGSAKGALGSDACLSCHESEIHEKRPGKNMHMSADVNCSDCHAVHQSVHAPSPLLVSRQEELCISCHSDQKAIFSKPFTHKMGHGAVECASCHDPHGGKGRKKFRAGMSSEETCVTCHAEKKGPFVFEHVTGLNGDCMSCHESHGSSNPRQLTRSNTRQLCLECHSTMPSGPIGSQPPSTHDYQSPRYRDCVQCHTAIHGSSKSPALLK